MRGRVTGVEFGELHGDCNWRETVFSSRLAQGVFFFPPGAGQPQKK